MRGNGAFTFSSLLSVALEDLAAPPRASRARGRRRDEEVLGELHVAVEVHERDLGLDHPELGEVAARLRLLGAEGRAEAVDLAERRRRGLHVELARLREVGVLAVEVVGLEEGGRALARAGREDGRVDEREAVAVEVVADGLDDRRRGRAGSRAGAAERSQRWRCSIRNADPVLLGGDGVLLGRRRRPRGPSRRARSRWGSRASFFTRPRTMIAVSCRRWSARRTARARRRS